MHLPKLRRVFARLGPPALRPSRRPLRGLLRLRANCRCHMRFRLTLRSGRKPASRRARVGAAALRRYGSFTPDHVVRHGKAKGTVPGAQRRGLSPPLPPGDKPRDDRGALVVPGKPPPCGLSAPRIWPSLAIATVPLRGLKGNGVRRPQNRQGPGCPRNCRQGTAVPSPGHWENREGRVPPMSASQETCRRRSQCGHAVRVGAAERGRRQVVTRTAGPGPWWQG